MNGKQLTLLQGNCLETLRSLKDESVQCCVTSPPYYSLRDYQVPADRWPEIAYRPMPGLPEIVVPAQLSCLGMEKSPEAFVGHIVAVFREVKRVLRNDGTLFLNFGDSYGNEKQLMGIPWRVAFALQADGWHLRQDVIWSKPAPMPESVRDRCTKAHEYIFLMSKSQRYFFDAQAVAEPTETSKETAEANWLCVREKRSKAYAASIYNKPDAAGFQTWRPTRNRRSVWAIASVCYKAAHFATFPPTLAHICISAGTSEKGGCPHCGAPWSRRVKRRKMVVKPGPSREERSGDGKLRTQVNGTMVEAPSTETIGWTPACKCPAHAPIPCTVLDPFGGSGTTGQVAIHTGRHAILCELQPSYIPLIEARVATKPKLRALGGDAPAETFARRKERHSDGGAFTRRIKHDPEQLTLFGGG